MPFNTINFHTIIFAQDVTYIKKRRSHKKRLLLCVLKKGVDSLIVECVLSGLYGITRTPLLYHTHKKHNVEHKSQQPRENPPPQKRQGVGFSLGVVSSRI